MVRLPFSRKSEEQTSLDTDQTSQLPPEVQDYYETSQRQRTGVAWLLAGATLVVTLLLAMLLFLGGRFVYRKITSKDQSKPPATTQTQTSQPQNQGGQVPSQQGGGSQTPSSPTPSTPSTPAPSTPSQPSPQPSPAPSSTAGGKTPNTGPGDMVAIFIGTTILGTVAYYAVQLRKQN
jgi:uncharacterized protein HemX